MMFATRTGRDRPSRVVVDVTEGDETSGVVIIVKRVKPGHYVLITCWIGSLAQKEPWGKSINVTCPLQPYHSIGERPGG